MNNVYVSVICWWSQVEEYNVLVDWSVAAVQLVSLVHSLNA